MRRAILVIEKSSIFQEIRPILPLAGYEAVACMKNGMEALRLLHRYEPDLIIADWSIHGLKTQEFLETVLIQNLCPIILILTAEEYQSLTPARQIEAHQILLYPLRALDLLAGVQTVEQRFKREKELNERIRRLEQELSTRKLIFQAQLKLIHEFGHSEETAYTVIRNQAMATRKNIAATARDIIKGVWMPERGSNDGDLG
ncbi:ANTAR domain-containing response regulator [Paradesulfitobacterium ferrireducens]|uniref:ANTAR domain-containing response regulator n=1 Tax=Paradesulfitobacterium ferrireducens TaxID=2816476 RepID=UPI001A8F22BE|nr:ANTAR domain-containing protein [Paradesulfitobacterium ferrireducens]